MTMPVSTTPKLTKLRNYNNCLQQKYFAQISDFPENWQNMIGTISDIEHEEIKESMQVKLINIQQIYAGELKQNLEMAIFINMENMPTVKELCGFDEENFRKFLFYTGYTGKRSLGIFIFKNLNFTNALIN